MKILYLKSHAPFFLFILGFSSARGEQMPQTAYHQVTSTQYIEDQERIEAAAKEVCTRFTQNFGKFKNLLNGIIDPKSKEKLSVTRKKLQTTITEVEDLFIKPMRAEYNQMQKKGVTHSSYCKLLKVLLDIADELKDHFNLLHSALSSSLQGKPTAIKVANKLKPVIDKITSDANFKKMDAYLKEAYSITSTYNFTIEIDPSVIKLTSDAENICEPYVVPLAQTFAAIRVALEDFRTTPQELKPGDILRLIRKRL